jgi:hypothetical protein
MQRQTGPRPQRRSLHISSQFASSANRCPAFDFSMRNSDATETPYPTGPVGTVRQQVEENRAQSAQLAIHFPPLCFAGVSNRQPLLPGNVGGSGLPRVESACSPVITDCLKNAAAYQLAHGGVRYPRSSKARDYGITVAGMKRDWNGVF